MTTTVEPKPLSSIKNAKVRQKLAELCGECRMIHDEIRAAQEAKKALMAEISAIGRKHKIQKVAREGWVLTRSKGRKTLKKELLLAQGVAIEVIEKATVPGEGFYQVLEGK